MSCPTNAELVDFLTGRLPESDLERVVAHVNACGHCQQQLDEIPEADDHHLSAFRHLDQGELLNSACGEMITRVLSEDCHAEPEQLPSELRDYVLGEQLGCGGMGIVYEATHQRLKRPVAIKLLRSRHAHEGAIARFQREMEAIGRVEHDNIVRALDAGKAEGFEFLVMERIHGRNLREVVEARGKLSAANACEVVRQAACGLSHAHELNLVHRDVKPSNLMVAADGTVKLLDLGLALIAEHSHEVTETPSTETVEQRRDDTATGVVIGSAGYMSPEQAQASHNVDYRTDIYSLGRTLSFLLSGQVPTTGEDKTLRQLEHVLEPRLLQLLKEMTAEDPESRPQTAGEIAHRLTYFTRDADLTSLTTEDVGRNGFSQFVGRAAIAEHDASSRATKSRRWGGALVLVVLVVMGVGGWMWRSGYQQTNRDQSNAAEPWKRGEEVKLRRVEPPPNANNPGVVTVPGSVQIGDAGTRETAAAFQTKEGLAISVTRQEEDEITTEVLTGDEAQQYVKQRPMFDMQLLYRKQPMFVTVTEVKTEAVRVRVERASGFFIRARVWEGAEVTQPTYQFDGQNLNELMLVEDAWCTKYRDALQGRPPANGRLLRGTVQLQATGHRTVMLTDTSCFSVRIVEQIGLSDEPESGILLDAGPEPLLTTRAATLQELRADHPDAAALYDQTLQFFGSTIQEMAQPDSPD
ncbi:MAG TPA: hypothetical protein DCY79_22795 [Planctomycetaceae bacterium]|nr:hypothetical protein [Planctomycetaceae bacterium]